MQAEQEAFRQELDKLFRDYVQRLPERLQSIRQLVSALETDPDPEERLRELHTLTHKLAGSAGTYGCPEVGKVAREFELMVSTHLNVGECLETAAYEQLAEELRKLATAIDQAVVVAGDA